jgi:hypothetical protein
MRGGRGARSNNASAGVPDLLAYGRIKAPATEILMAAAEPWAARGNRESVTVKPRAAERPAR